MMPTSIVLVNCEQKQTKDSTNYIAGSTHSIVVCFLKEKN